jgi:hypothetical protein
MTLPRTYVRLDDILKTDPVTPANGVTSTIKIFSESQTAPIYEWLTGDMIPGQSKDDPDVVVSGDGIEAIVGYASLQPWDWDGNVDWVSRAPNWTWGGRNLLGNPGFEDSPCQPEVNTITLDPTVSGGTFTLSNSNGTTDPIAWNAAAVTVEGEIEDVGTGPVLDDVSVTGSGTVADPWVITFIEPCVFESGLVANFASLTPAPGTSALVRTQFGVLVPSPWTKSQTVSSGTTIINGDYTSFRVTTAEAHTGTFSLLVDPAPIGRRFAGAQQVVGVQIGMLYQASIWVKTNSASQEYRFVVRGIDEDILLDVLGNEAVQQLTLASGVWTQFSIPNIAVGNNERVIVRIANINVSGNPAIFYVDDGVMAEGLAVTTVGSIWQRVYNDATINHAGRVVWEDDANPGTPYLSNDFDAVNDSAGVPWDRSDIGMTFQPRMNYLQILGEFVKLGYEWRVVPDSTPGYYLLQIYNPGTLGGVIAAGIQTGAADIRRNARYLAPRATHLTVQGQAQLSSRAASAGLDAAFGRIEGSLLDQNLTSTVDAQVAAVDGIASNNLGAESLVYTLRPYAGISEPLVAYRPGDEITIEDPGIVTGQRRVSQIELAWDKTGAEYTVYLGSVALVGQTAVNQAVYDLLKKFERADELPQPAAVTFGGSGGAPTVVVAAVNSTGMSQGKADFVCDGVADQGMINQALAIIGDVGGRVLLAEGNYNLTAGIVLPCYTHLLGMNKNSTYIELSVAVDTATAIDARNEDVRLSDFTVDAHSTHCAPAGIVGVRIGNNGQRADNVLSISEGMAWRISTGITCGLIPE